MQDPRVTKCLEAKRESRAVEFKQEFQPSEAAQSLEILKDIAAIANSGGGTLAIGLDNSGKPLGKDVSAVLAHDHAKYCDLVHKYTNQNYCDFEVVEVRKNGHQIAVFVINSPDFPLVFEKPGTYAVGKDQRTAFGQGTVYFRHGAKSEHGTSDDLRRFMQQRMREMQEQLMKGLRKVSEAPRGSQVRVVPSISASHSDGNAMPFRITNDAKAEGVMAIDRGRICPYRRKEVLQKLKEHLPDKPVSTFDLSVVNKVYNTTSKEEFCWQPEYSSPQYSDAFVDWLVAKIKQDQNFLQEARQKAYAVQHP